MIWGSGTSWGETEHMLDATQLPLEKKVALIVSRCTVEEYNKLLGFWHRRRPDVMVSAPACLDSHHLGQQAGEAGLP